MAKETGVPGENHCLTPITSNVFTYSGWDSNPGSDERQLAVSGNALDHMTTRAACDDSFRVNYRGKLTGKHS